MAIIQPLLGLSLNRNHPLCKNLEVCYPLTEGGGGYINEIVKGLAQDRGTLLKSATGVIPSWTVFQEMRGLKFTASSYNLSGWYMQGGYIETPISDSWKKNGLGISCSFWYKSNTTTGTQRIIDYWDSCRGYIIYISGGQMAFLIDTAGGGGSISIGTTTGIDTTTLHHCCCTYDGANLIIYIDGLEKNRGAWTASVTTSTQVNRIGSAELSNVRYYDGFLANIGIWSRALTATEARQLYINPYQMYILSNNIKYSNQILSIINTGFFNFM